MIYRYAAPEGMVAVRKQNRYTCIGCSFDEGGRNCYYDSLCSAEEREDETDVIFKTRADFEAILLKELEQFYNIKITKPVGKVYGIVFYTVEKPTQRIKT